jgi:hypothetical protein
MNIQENNEDEMPKLSIQQENEFKKMKLKLEHNAIFPDSSQMNLPPEIEGMFLDSIFNFEKAYKNSRKITVYEKLGAPKFKNADELSDLKLDKALFKITKLMETHNLVLDVICDYEQEERLIYKFITEELFLHEIEDYNIPGMNTCFIYEDFHPNHRYDLERTTEDFLKMFFDKKSDFYDQFHEKDASNHLEINNFRSLFNKFKIKNFEFKKVSFNKKTAKTTFEIDFWAKIEGSNSKINYSGKGSLSFKFKNRFWYVDQVNLPIITNI